MTQRIVESILEEAKKHGASEVTAVYLTIGEFTFLEEEAVRTAYEALTKGTPLEGSVLHLTFEKGVVECPCCGYKGKVHLSEEQKREHHHEHREHLGESPVIHCPKCESPAKILSGRECIVEKVKMKVEDKGR
jgi:hydrogenase nickel incorporation protein HypA/HybF